MFRASFVVGSTTVNFGAMVLNHQDTAGPLRELSCGVHFATEADWNNFRQQICYLMDVIPIPWGSTVEVLVKGGPGSGTLTIPGLTPSSYTAWLREATRDWQQTVTGHTTGKAKFLLSAS